ncbi:hypothetical protein NMG60_11029040 [Bertholletia excelsa]
MANKEEGEETVSRGNEWEVVSLTASAYAASPGPQPVELNENDQVSATKEDGAETSQAMFMSGHFVFPPSQHENLPLEPENIEIQNVQESNDVPKLDAEEGGKSNTKVEDSWKIKGLDVPDEFPGIQYFDEKGNRQDIHETEFESDTSLHELHLIEKEQSVYSSSEFSSYPTTFDDTNITPGQVDPAEESLDSDTSKLPKLSKEDKYNEAGPPCEAWWKKRAASLYSHGKEVNAFWSIFIAAAVMGLVILGQHWQQERWQVLQLKWQSSVHDGKMGRMLAPISRLKDVIVGGNRRGAFIRSNSSPER